MDAPKLFLLDAYALIYRAYYALFKAPRVTSQGFNTSAIFGFCNSLDEILRKENPSHIAVCFDPHGPTFRHEAYEAYKADREAMPEDIRSAIPYIKQIIEAQGITIVEVPGYEADDVIGTLSRHAEAAGITTYMMTPDKDFGQLVTDNVYIYRPALKGADFEVRGVKEVCQRYGLSSPLQVIDLLALQGDAIDNIPGCPGVGEKTAVRLIGEWGSVENLLDNADSLRGALRQKVIDNAEQIRFSKFLATIKTDVPVDITIDQLRRRDADTDRLIEIYTQLEFKTFINRLRPVLKKVESKVKTDDTADTTSLPSLFDQPDLFSSVSAPTAYSFDASDGKYAITDSLDDARAIIDRACRASSVGVSVQAKGSDAMTALFTGVAVAFGKGDAAFISLSLGREAVIDLLRRLFGSSTLLVSHDIKRDIIILRNIGVEFTAPYYDTSVAHYLLQPEVKHRLSSIAASHLCYYTRDYDEDSRTKKAVELPCEEIAIRACESADVVLQLRGVFQAELEHFGLAPLMTDIELPLIRVLADMEWEGVRVDVKVLAEQSKELTSRLRSMEAEAYRLAGGEFNLSSPMQVGEVLFGRLRIDPKAKRTKKGAFSTTEEILEKHRATHPLVGLILDIRGLRKLLTTYINALPELINPHTGRIHTSFNQTVTATGRISSANPNLQNIPVRTDDGREIRRAFIANPGDLFMSADYSQIELRIIADLAGDESMIDAFRSGADIHRATAAKIYHVPIEEVTDDQRRHAKTANFGIIYGISAFGLSERLGISRTESKALIEGYFKSFPGIKLYMDNTIARAREDGFVSTICGRKRMLPDINSHNAVVRGYAERNAINAPIQGSAADIIKRAMIDIARDFASEGLRSRMIVQVHDELVFNVVPDELERVRQIVERDMKAAYTGRVPMEVASGIGNNWLEAH